MVAGVPGWMGDSECSGGPMASMGPGGVPGWLGVPGSHRGLGVLGGPRVTWGAQGVLCHLSGRVRVPKGPSVPWCPSCSRSRAVWGPHGAHVGSEAPGVPGRLGSQGVLGSRCIRGAHRSRGWLRAFAGAQGPLPSGVGGGQGARGSHCTQGSHGGWEAPCPQSRRDGHTMPEAPRERGGVGGWGEQDGTSPQRGARDEPRMDHQRAPAAMGVGAGRQGAWSH